MLDFFSRRLELARANLKEEEVLLLSTDADVAYFTGFSGDSSWLLLSPVQAVFITDGRYTEQIRQEARIPLQVECISTEYRLKDILKKHLSSQKLQTIYLNKSRLTLDRYELLQEVLGGREISLLNDSITPELRMVKDPIEIETITRNLQLTEWGYQTILPAVKEGVSEKQLAAQLEYNLRCQGADRTAFDTIIASGARAALPHGTASTKLIQKDQVVLFDFGVFADGYASDFTRCYYFGKIIDPKIKEIHAIVEEAVQTALSVIRPGVTCGEVHEAAYRTIDKHGYADYFTHSTGHGVGLEIHEAPRLSAGSDTILREGMVFTIEPGIYLPEKGGIRLEDMAVVVRNGSRRLTQSDYSL